MSLLQKHLLILTDYFSWISPTGVVFQDSFTGCPRYNSTCEAQWPSAQNDSLYRESRLTMSRRDGRQSRVVRPQNEPVTLNLAPFVKHYYTNRGVSSLPTSVHSWKKLICRNRTEFRKTQISKVMFCVKICCKIALQNVTQINACSNSHSTQFQKLDILSSPKCILS